MYRNGRYKTVNRSTTNSTCPVHILRQRNFLINYPVNMGKPSQHELQLFSVEK